MADNVLPTTAFESAAGMVSQVANMRGRISWSRDLRQCLVDIQAFRPLWPTWLATEAKGEQNNRCSFNGGKLSLFAGEINRNG